MRTITLNCLAGPLKGESFTLGGGPVFMFGRHPKVTCSLAADPAASHLHFLIDTSDNRVRVIDLGSTNGLVINEKHMGGKKGEPFTDFVTLESGDTILAGASLFRISVVGDVDTAGYLASSQPGTGTGTITPDVHNRPIPTAQAHSSTVRETGGAAGRSAQSKRQENGLPAIPGFTLIEGIGAGGKGHVYRAVRDDSGAAAAIKILTLGRQGTLRAMESFQREIEMTKRLDHPNIIKYLGDGFTGGAPYLATEFVGGGNLEELIASEPEKRLNLPQSVPLFIQILEAISYMHSLDLVHRDIKPKNVLLDLRRGGSMAAKLSDMGLTSWSTVGVVAGSMPIPCENGTPFYMAPEQLADPVKAIPQSDVYGAAATLYHMLTGTPLYGSSLAANDGTDTVAEGKIIPIERLRPDLSPNFASVMAKALAYKPEDRYADAHQFLDAFRQALS